jgi:hypothetical protein
MKPDIVLEYAGQDCQLWISLEDIRVLGPSDGIAMSLQAMAETARESYSPSAGDGATYIAQELARRTGARIKSVRMAPTRKGVVY